MNSLLNLLLNFFLVICIQFAAYLLIIDGVSHVVGIVFELILGLDLFLVLFVLRFIFLSFLDHALNLFLGKASFVISDRNFVLLSSSLVFGRNI
mmetsp:Transcript_23709/g.32651  ORF Transcript_23709/g.32651 Transcript_23709/m.32651 type:complete len:94 (-) Transcript_23709:1542-1823(-)